MEGEDTNKDEKDLVKSTSSEGCQRASVDGEKVENRPREDEHEVHGETSGSGSENQKNMSKTSDKAVEGNGSDADSSSKMSHASEEIPAKEKENESDSEEPNKMSQNTHNVEETGSYSDEGKKSSHDHTTEEVHVIDKGSDSDSENMSKHSQTAENVEKESDSDSEDPNKMSHIREEVHNVDKDLGPGSNNVNGYSDSGSPNKKSHTSQDIHVVDKESNSESEKLNKKSQPAEEAEKNSDSDSENLKKMSMITKDILVEEEIGMAYERSNEVSETIEDIIEVKEVDPVFDGTEAPEAEARKSPSSQTLDLYPDSPTTWNGKAVALKNLVKMKGAVAVSTVLRRLSGGKDVVGPDEEEKNVIVEGTDEEPVMMGRIILYTMLGCQESKEVRSLLREKGLHFVEINVDIYPGRKLELETKTGSSALPRLYLNDLIVGGWSELKAMAESGKLDEQIKVLMHEEPSNEAPLPPFPGEDDVSASGRVDELASIVKKMKESIAFSDRFYKLRRFSSCFVGSEAVDFLSHDQDFEREEAVNLGRKLVKAHFFRHVLDENIFEDGNHLYRFLEHDPLISTNCYNMTRGINELKPKRITEIASRLRFLSFAIFEAYVSEDGRHVDYKSIHGCEEYRRYLRIIEELQRVELDKISREEKLAFFINLYNMMAIHAILSWGFPTGAMDRKKLFGEFKYVIGGCPYSLSAIQNGVLRANQRPPYNISKPFGPKDMRFKVALPYMEPLVHFALVCGSISGPPLRCYSPGNIDMELMEAARNFLRNGGLLVDAEARTASASSIIRWYSADFGKNEAEVMKHLSNYLEPSKSQNLLDLLAGNQLRVTYQPYDWGING